VTGGNMSQRVQGLGLSYVETDGRQVDQVWETARLAIERARSGEGPTFLHAQCVHLEGHFLGYQLLRATRNPLREMPRIAGPLTRSFMSFKGASLRERMAGLKVVLSSVVSTLKDPRRDSGNDPVMRTRAALRSDSVRLMKLETAIEQEITETLSSALKECTA
jgi:hypothetical protein